MDGLLLKVMVGIRRMDLFGTIDYQLIDYRLIRLVHGC